MTEYKCELFYDDIENMSRLELADWIKQCQTFLDRTRYDNKREYLDTVKDFTDEWTRHYEEHKDFYGKAKYKTALLSLAVPSAEVYTLFDSKNQPLDIMRFQTPNTHSPFITDLGDRLQKADKRDLELYIKKVTECFSARYKSVYKEKLDEIIKKHLTKKSVIQLKKLNGKNINSYESYDELIKDIEDIKNYKVKIIDVETTKIVDFYDRYHACIDDRYIKIGYQEQFKENGISKTVYSKFLSKQTWEQDFDKKFFINLGFLLSLPYSMLNTLLSYNGYSLNASTRKFDEIMDRAFKIGFGRDLAIDLIDFYNFEMLDEYGTKIVNGKEKENFGKVPSLNSIKENEEIPSA